MVTIFIDIANVFVSSGFGLALVQKKNADNKDFSTVFYFNIIFSCILYLIIFSLAPNISKFYGNQLLSPVIRVMAIKLPLAGINSVQNAYVERKMLFKKFFYSTLIGTIVSAIVGIILAYRGFGVWALVFQYIVNSTCDTLILWFTVKWRPEIYFSIKRMKNLFGFGWRMLLSSLINTIYMQLRSLIIGRVYTTQDLAYYNQGRKMPNLFVTNICSTIDSVLFPTMSKSQNDIVKLKKMVRKSIKISSYFMWPIMLGMFVISETLVRLILTEKWIPCVPFMRIACIQLALIPIQTSNLQAIKALGKSSLYLKLEIIKKLLEY